MPHSLLGLKIENFLMPLQQMINKNKSQINEHFQQTKNSQLPE